MDNNTKNILYPKGSIFQTLKDDKIDKNTIIYKGSLVTSATNIKENDKFAEVYYNGDAIIIETDIMELIRVGDPEKSTSIKSVKNDIIDDKLRWDLLPMEEIEDIVKVYHAGAKKYGPNNWQNLDNGFERYRAAAARHIMAYLKGERMDKETNVHHLAAAAWNVITMLWYDKHGKGLMPLNKEEKK